MARERAIVLGAGIQGVCCALALRHRGFHVTLVDSAPDCMLRASLRNTAKIHLGFVYVKDPTFRSPLLMLDAALGFDRLLTRWTGDSVEWPAIKSRPFTYVVLPGSLLAPHQILEAYHRLQEAYRRRVDEGAGCYLGATPERLWQETSALAAGGMVAGDLVLGSVTTAEVAIDLTALRRRMQNALAGAGGIETLYGHEVDGVSRGSCGFRAQGRGPAGQPWTLEGGLVVNCLWDRRLALDARLGLHPRRPWLYRLKYRLFADLPPSLSALPSLTFVQGPFGDLVVYPWGRIYISWYPVCLRGWCSDLAPPAEWDGPCSGVVDQHTARDLARGALEAFEPIVPGIAACHVDHVDAGIICSWGETDIDDPDSELHERYDVGVHAHDGYFSIDTGKFTCAPLFADQLLARLSSSGSPGRAAHDEPR